MPRRRRKSISINPLRHGNLNEIPLAAIADAYGFPDSPAIEASVSGTAGSGAVIRVGADRFFLRKRSAEHSKFENLTYEHELLAALTVAAVPVAPPRATTGGETYFECDGGIYEVSPYIAGVRFTPADRAELYDLGVTLGKFHRATESIMRCKQGQTREDDPERLRRDLASYLADSLEEITWDATGDAPAAASADTARRIAKTSAAGDVKHALDLLDRLLLDLADELNENVYGILPECVIHGDVHTGNLLFHDRRVAGVFDFDWANRQERLRDVGDAVLFFAGIGDEARDTSDIWALTEKPILAGELTNEILKGYTRECPITDEELRALPAVMTARWLQARIRGMRKVAPDRRFDFLDRGDLLATVEEIRGVTF